MTDENRGEQGEVVPLNRAYKAGKGVLTPHFHRSVAVLDEPRAPGGAGLPG
jgi:hypothetical protein